MTFEQDIAKFISATKIKTEVVVRRIAFDAYTRVVRKTPVDTGRARANWQVAINNLPTGQLSPGQRGVSLGNMNAYKLGDVIYIANNLPYIGVLEYGGYPNPPKSGGITKSGKSKTVGGFSRQAPQGMVGLTLIEIKKNIRKAVSGL